MPQLRPFSWIVTAVLLVTLGHYGLVVAPLPAANGDGAERPNIVLLLADDLGWGDVGFNGSEVVNTPHLDAMAANGLRFTRFYAAAPVCSPTRGSVVVMLPAVDGHRPTRRVPCSNNLRQIGLALQSYHATHGSFPPAYLSDDKGAPQHGWRVLLLPFLEQQALYESYDFNEPWNGPNNSKLLDSMPSVYSCPSHDYNSKRGDCPSYLAVVDPRTAWPGEVGANVAEFKDGTSNTALVVEFNNRTIPWLEPKDLAYGEALELLTNDTSAITSAHWWEDFFYRYSSGGRQLVFADGSVRWLKHGIDEAAWSAILQKDDGMAWDGDLEDPPQIVRRLKISNCLRLAVFAILVLLPLPWVWLNPTSLGRTESHDSE